MAEGALNILRKLEANKACANCDTISKFGHSNVCDKFKTFVCNNCKSAHQSYSHRVKSVTMSNWTKEEVDALKEENGGGNAVARRTWFGKWEDGRSMRKPAENDHLDVFKRFINAAYNEKAFYTEYNAKTTTINHETPVANTTSSKKESNKAATTSSDLLGFSPTATPAFEVSFEAFSAPVQPVQNTSFDAFSAPVKPTQAQSPTFDAFSAPVKPTQAQSPTFDAFSAPVPPSNTSSSSSFDPFGFTAPAAPSSNNSQWSTFQGASQPSQPIMNNTSYDPFSAAMPPSLNTAGMPTSSYQAPPIQNPMTNAMGGHSISSLMAPTLVANPLLQHNNMYGHGYPPQNNGYNMYGNQDPGYNQQQPSYPNHAPKNNGRDPFAGLAFS
ncbi:hypothetical protein THRCLA_20414 [Thraustotheca clavata]|uniref:Arf-GAP domain-containing protein n=1 Tax=Thraustotheca clavata TaxID=74557 RepID=A0A1W0A7G9_9STRA|nr:hypothetical protein THRCLA_20414 [Thraustotheca clavata]